MSRTNPYEVCARCETFHLSSEMSTIYARDAKGVPMALRVCRSCLHPHITYIQGPAGLFPQWRWPNFDAGRVLIYALALIIAVLNVVFGLVTGNSIGFAIALIGIFLGAGILVAEAASQCGR